MTRPVFADPKTDFVFQRIFGSEDHKPVLLGFLNDLLELDDAHRIQSVSLLPPEQRPKVSELKYSIVDVKCVDVRGTTYVVEMQVLNVEAFEKRVMYNVAKACKGFGWVSRRYAACSGSSSPPSGSGSFKRSTPRHSKPSCPGPVPRGAGPELVSV